MKKILQSTLIESIPKPKSGKVITIDSKEKLFNGFQTLIKNDILSAPVYDKEKKEYVGFLDTRDLVSFVVFVFDEQKVQDNHTLEDIVKHGSNMFQTPTTDGVTVSYLARRNKFLPVKTKENLDTVMSILSREGVHRLAVVNEKGELVNIVSQTTIIGYIDRLSKKELESETKKRISDIKIGTRPIMSVDKHATVIDTFRLMDSNKRSGIAIVDKSQGGRLVGTTTGKDLKLFIQKPTLSALKLPIFEFLNQVRQTAIDIRSPTIAVFEKDSLGLAIGKLWATRVHRVWIVNNEESYKPIGVISVTDILVYLLKVIQ